MIETDIQQTKRLLTGDTLRDLRKAAKKLGQMRESSLTFKHVILDGLVEKAERGLLDYRPWRLTATAREIMELARN